MKYSGFFRRFFAFTLDVLVIITLYVVLGLTFGMIPLFSKILELPMVGFWFYGGMLALAWFYFAGFESSKMQATIGKKVFRLRVVDLKGKRIGFFRATARYFSKILSRLIFMFGFLMILFTKKKQALHDKVARTVVTITK